MKKETPFLDLHRRIIKRGYTVGLCGEDIDRHTFSLFKPPNEVIKYCYSAGWWAADEIGILDYGPTRQNIVLFCAAINGEL